MFILKCTLFKGHWSTSRYSLQVLCSTFCHLWAIYVQILAHYITSGERGEYFYGGCHFNAMVRVYSIFCQLICCSFSSELSSQVHYACEDFGAAVSTISFLLVNIAASYCKNQSSTKILASTALLKSEFDVQDIDPSSVVDTTDFNNALCWYYSSLSEAGITALWPTFRAIDLTIFVVFSTLDINSCVQNSIQSLRLWVLRFSLVWWKSEMAERSHATISDSSIKSSRPASLL